MRRAIRVLSPETVSRIAAGEVVERPASVVKELVENSLDAGASQISVDVKGSGVNYIRVSDNGVGLAADEAEIAFQRHATSKITALADLDGTTTLGFRGEALPSIAQVSHVEMLTSSRDDASGVYLNLTEGNVVRKEARACPHGTTVTVRHLFRNVPARLKFLKSATTENNQISNLVSQYCLAFPEVRFVLTIDGRSILRTPGSGRLRDALAEVYGVETAQAMLEVKAGEGQGGLALAVSGYVSPPSVNRAARNCLSFFVNRRWVQSRLLTGAVEKAYEGWLAVRRHPIVALNLTMDPGLVDVNVHPAKREVRLAQESVVFGTVHGAVRRTLAEKAPVPDMSQSAISAPVGVGRKTETEIPSTAAGSRPVPLLMPDAAPRELPVLRVLGQVAGAYVIAEGPDGLYLIDQHAAHERVLFDRILAQREDKTAEVQSLLEPIAIELSPKQEALLKAEGELMAQFGFCIEPFGDRTCLVRAVPSVVAGGKIGEAVKETLDSMDHEADAADVGGRIARSLACHGAIRAGQILSQGEMRELIGQLERTASPRTCPHGRPTMLHLSSVRLDKEFGRT